MARRIMFVDEAFEPVTAAYTFSGKQTMTGGAAISGGTTIGNAAADTVGFYGAAPAAQRPTNSIHVTSNVAAYSSTTASALIGAFLVEVANTLIGLGIWSSP